MSDPGIFNKPTEALAYMVECEIATLEWMRLLKRPSFTWRSRPARFPALVVG